jgi:uncharacterized RDD family membrane protein YckC
MLSLITGDSMNYAGFWRRFGALWLDVIVLLPLTALIWWGEHRFRLFSLYYFIPGQLFKLFYDVYLVRRYGGTPGKRLLRISIRKTDGSPVGYREALLRYLPEAALAALVTIGMIYAEVSMNDATYAALGFGERAKQLTALAPAWYRPADIMLQIWIFSEVIVMLTNRRRRALHDFIAGTIVIRDAPQPGRARPAATGTKPRMNT